MNTNFSHKFFSLHEENSKYYLILFILWPFLAFLLALSNYSQKEGKTVVYIFLIYFGLTFVIGKEYIDAAGYAYTLKANAGLPFSEFFSIVFGIYATDTSIDIVEPLISFIVSRFTADHSILFALYAAIFGFFYLKSVNLLYNRYKENPGWNVLIHLIFFTVILPITTISGFRMWTAAWIFFYGAYHVILHRDTKFIFFALGSTLVHWSFLSANIILIIYFIVGNRNMIYMPLAILSFVLPNFLVPVFRSSSLLLGGGFQSRFEMYTNEDYLLARQDAYADADWFLTMGNDLVFYYLLLAIIIIKIFFKDIMKEEADKNLFSFLLLFLSFVNFGKIIPSFGGRFQTLFFLFATLFIFLYFIKRPGNKINLLSLVGLFPMALYTAVAFRQGSDTINAWMFAPGLGLPLFVPDLSISDFLFH